MRKIFKHNFVSPKVELTEEMIDNKRFYVTPKGDKLKSVTTILSENSDQTWLYEWRKRIGERKADSISLQATRRGTALHNIAERYVLNIDPYVEDEIPFHIEMFKPAKKALDEHVDQIYGCELPLYSVALKTAGRTDLIAQFDGINSVIDYKTSKRIKSEDQITNYFLQSTVYSLMFERIYNVQVPQIVIIMIVEDEHKPLIFIKDRGKYINRVLEIFCK